MFVLLLDNTCTNDIIDNDVTENDVIDSWMNMQCIHYLQVGQMWSHWHDALGVNGASVLFSYLHLKHML